MSIEDLYRDFLESDHKDSTFANKAIESANSAETVIDGIEEEMHAGFVSGFIAGINFMKGALR